MTSTYPQENPSSGPAHSSPSSNSLWRRARGSLSTGSVSGTQERFHRESQRGHGSVSTGRVSGTREPFHRERQRDPGAFPREASAGTREPFHGDSQRGHRKRQHGEVSVDPGRTPGSWFVSQAGPLPLWASVSFLYIHSTAVKNQLKEKENKILCQPEKVASR